MFSKPKKNGAASPQSPPPRKTVPPSILSEDLHIVGNLKSDGDIQIDGRVDGDIQSKHVTIGESATVNGAIDAEDLKVSGTVNGEITGKKVELANTARVVGDINHDVLQIEAGAYLQGLCRRMGADEGSAKPKSDGAASQSEASSPDVAQPSKLILDAGKTA